MRLVWYDENHKLHMALCLCTLVFSALKVETTAAAQAQDMASCEKWDFFLWQHRSLQFVHPLGFIFHLYMVTDPVTAMRSILHYTNKTEAVKIAISSCLPRIRCLLGCEFLLRTLGRDLHWANWNLIFSLHSQSQSVSHRPWATWFCFPVC